MHSFVSCLLSLSTHYSPPLYHLITLFPQTTSHLAGTILATASTLIPRPSRSNPSTVIFYLSLILSRKRVAARQSSDLSSIPTEERNLITLYLAPPPVTIKSRQAPYLREVCSPTPLFVPRAIHWVSPSFSPNLLPVTPIFELRKRDGSLSLSLRQLHTREFTAKTLKADIGPVLQRFGKVKLMCDGPPGTPEVSCQHVRQRSRRPR